MARYTEKDKATLAFNDIRTTVQGIANMRSKQARERALNRILPPLQKEFEQRLGTKDELIKLSPQHHQTIEKILAEELNAVLLG